MGIRWRKFLVATALAGLGALPACVVEVVEGPTGTGGVGGSAGRGGAGGTTGDAAPEGAASDAPTADGTSADVSGSDATEDVTTLDAAADGPAPDMATRPDGSPDVVETGSGADAGSPDGGIVDAPSDAPGACFAEDGADAGSTNDCAMLSYYGTHCPDDAGADRLSAGVTLCNTLDSDLKASAFLELFACLQSLPGGDGGMEACSSAHEQGAADCSRGIFNRSMCPVPDGVAEGGLYGCAQIAASCGPDSGAGGIPVELCQAWLGPFNAPARQGIIDCYLDPADVGATSCRDKFENYCVF